MGASPDDQLLPWKLVKPMRLPSPWPCSPTALSPASAGAQAKTLTVGSKDFSGAQVLSQAYGQALEAKGCDISFKDNLGADRGGVPRARDGDLDAYADYQGTLLTYLAARPTGDWRRDLHRRWKR